MRGGVRVGLLILVPILGGCLGGGSSGPKAPDAPTVDPPPALPTFLVLKDRAWAHDDPVAITPIPATAELTMVEVPLNATELVVTVTRTEKPPELMASNAIVGGPNGTYEQKPFSDAQLGNLDSTGEAHFNLTAPEPGLWRIEYRYIPTMPQGHHAGTLNATVRFDGRLTWNEADPG